MKVHCLPKFWFKLSHVHSFTAKNAQLPFLEKFTGQRCSTKDSHPRNPTKFYTTAASCIFSLPLTFSRKFTAWNDCPENAHLDGLACKWCPQHTGVSVLLPQHPWTSSIYLSVCWLGSYQSFHQWPSSVDSDRYYIATQLRYERELIKSLSRETTTQRDLFIVRAFLRRDFNLPEVSCCI